MYTSWKREDQIPLTMYKCFGMSCHLTHKDFDLEASNFTSKCISKSPLGGNKYTIQEFLVLIELQGLFSIQV